MLSVSAVRVNAPGGPVQSHMADPLLLCVHFTSPHPSLVPRLTEEDTEYVIHAVKHVYEEHVVVQFDCTNTIKEQVLENVTVVMDLADAVRRWGMGDRAGCSKGCRAGAL